MSRSVENLYVPPLLYDALSGEFIPPSDPMIRKHTLGRLAYAGFTKGMLVRTSSSVKDKNPDLDLFEAVYRPSWATTVQTHAQGTVHRDTKTFNLLGLDLFSDEGATMSVYRKMSADHEGLGVELITPDERIIFLALQLGESLNDAREQITQEAQTFFNQIV